MKKSELQFDYPEELVATEPQRPSRVLLVDDSIAEIPFDSVPSLFSPGDVLVLNDTRVLKRRVFSDDLEILFLKQTAPLMWEVLFPSRKTAVGEKIELPLGVSMKLLQKGRPQVVEVSQVLSEEYFERCAEIPLPPYIQKVRGERHTQVEDSHWYQTAWNQKPGSLASPTASLHFSLEDIEKIKARGVSVYTITLHVGLGTFLPVEAEDLRNHVMHHEVVSVSKEIIRGIKAAKSRGGRIWAMGTTVMRALESQHCGKLQEFEKSFEGSTDLLILPGYDFGIVDSLLTNFHQPESTLLALMHAFRDSETVRSAYRFAIENKFRLFSYGDLSIWKR